MVNTQFEKMLLRHNNLTDAEVRSLIRKQLICFGGNSKLKIYGTLNCASGKGLLKKSRVFFTSENAAREYGFRPCGNCMREAYNAFKNGLI